MLSCRLCGVHFFSRFSFTSLYRCLIARHHVKFLHAHTNIQFELCVFSILVRWKLQSYTWALVYCVQLFNFHGAPRAVVLSSYKPAWICWFDIFLNGNFSIIYFFYFIHFLTCCLFTRMLLIFAREAPCLCCFNEEEKNILECVANSSPEHCHHIWNSRSGAPVWRSVRYRDIAFIELYILSRLCS